MNGRAEGVPGQWYRDRASGEIFQVVGLDEQDRMLELQYADGDLDQMSSEEWRTSAPQPCEQPEDWVGPYDDLESDDIGMPEATAERHGAEATIERVLLDIEERGSVPVENAED